jgi:hypothetical protein
VTFSMAQIAAETEEVSGSRTRPSSQCHGDSRARWERGKQPPGCCPPLVSSRNSISPVLRRADAPDEGSGSAMGRRAVSVRGANTALHFHPVAVLIFLGSLLSPILRAQTEPAAAEGGASRKRNTDTSPCYGDKKGGRKRGPRRGVSVASRVRPSLAPFSLAERRRRMPSG